MADEAYRKLAEEEASPLSAEEREFADNAMAGLTEEQRAKVSEADLQFVVRGYQTYKPRGEETNKALKMIADWRDEHGYDDFLKKRLPQDEEFYKAWPERIHGADNLGHVVLAFQIAEVDTDALAAMDEDVVEKLVGQKLAMETDYKLERAKEAGVQRYKHIMVVDLAHCGMGMLMGKKGSLIKKLIDIGADMYPESVWKIFAINTPWLMRGAWSMVKPWVHPITQAKVNILKNADAAKKALEEIGCPADQIPAWCGGTNEGMDVFALLKETIAQNSDVAAAAQPSPSKAQSASL